MAYITKAQFNAYTDTEVSAAEFKILAEAASVIVDSVAMNRISKIGFDVLIAEKQEAVVNAVCAEVDCLIAQGGIAALNGNGDNGATSISIGKFSEGSPNAAGVTNSLQSIGSIPVGPLVSLYLRPTGLMFRGVMECDKSQEES